VTKKAWPDMTSVERVAWAEKLRVASTHAVRFTVDELVQYRQLQWTRDDLAADVRLCEREVVRANDDLEFVKKAHASAEDELAAFMSKIEQAAKEREAP
jgi:uncharacterized protein (DUF433 family)